MLLFTVRRPRLISICEEKKENLHLNECFPNLKMFKNRVKIFFISSHLHNIYWEDKGIKITEKGTKIERLILSPNDGKKTRIIYYWFSRERLKKQILYNIRNRT